MSNFDYQDLDGRTLRTFIAILENGSVSRAAAQLGITQSAVSHTLDKLRKILGDPLFVRAGRGIVPTSRTRELEAGVRQTLERMKELTDHHAFDPGETRLLLTIAANDFQRDLLLPPLFRRFTEQAPHIRLRVTPSGIPSVEVLRNRVADLILTPRPPDGPDILQKKLLEDRVFCFYDPSHRAAPQTPQQYREGRHISVAFGPDERTIHETHLPRPYRPHNIAVVLPDFSGIPLFLQGTDLIATLPGMLGRRLLQPFAASEPPFATPPVPIYMVWHRRNHLSPAHQWIRHNLEQCVTELR